MRLQPHPPNLEAAKETRRSNQALQLRAICLGLAKGGEKGARAARLDDSWIKSVSAASVKQDKSRRALYMAASLLDLGAVRFYVLAKQIMVIRRGEELTLGGISLVTVPLQTVSSLRASE